MHRTQIGSKYIDNNYKPWRGTQVTEDVEVLSKRDTSNHFIRILIQSWYQFAYLPVIDLIVGSSRR
jgi:hypothetical protein